MHWVFATRTGRKGLNQDRLWVSDDGRAAVVADGASVNPQSQRASQCVVDVARSLYRTGLAEGFLGPLVEQANRTLLARIAAGEDVGYTTLSAVHHVAPNMVLALAFGDSPILNLRAGRMPAAVRPHRRYDSIIERGLVRAAEADALFENLPWWARLYLNIWLPQPRTSLKAGLQALDVAQGDLLVLCTDGLIDAIPPAQLAAELGPHPDDAVLGRLLERAAERSDDDLTCAAGVV